MLFYQCVVRSTFGMFGFLFLQLCFNSYLQHFCCADFKRLHVQEKMQQFFNLIFILHLKQKKIWTTVIEVRGQQNNSCQIDQNMIPAVTTVLSECTGLLKQKFLQFLWDWLEMPLNIANELLMARIQFSRAHQSLAIKFIFIIQQIYSLHYHGQFWYNF